MIWEEIGRDRASSVKCAHRYKHCCVMNPQIRALAKMQVPLMKSCCPSGIPFSSKDGWWNMRLMLEETGKDTVGSSLLLYWCLNWSQPLKLDRVASEYSVLTKIRVWLHKQWNQKCSHCPSSNERRKNGIQVIYSLWESILYCISWGLFSCENMQLIPQNPSRKC